MTADLLATVCAEIEARRELLRPAVAEYGQLLSAAAALDEEDRKRAAGQKIETARKTPVVRAAPAPAKAPVRNAPATRKPTRRKAAAPREKAAAPKKASAPPAGTARSAAQQAIAAALEHGSHTVAELAVVTAMSGPSIREGLRSLLKAGKITKAKREGKAAYALAS
jgi:DNA-binding transcriptional ArsR family regulator